MKSFYYSLFLITTFFIQSCTNELPVRNEVIVHTLSEPIMLNPINFSDATSGYITNHMFQKLIDNDFRNPIEFVPILAVSRPVIEKTPEGKMLITFKLRKEARWDNGSPVSAKDVEFTIKTMRCPLVNNQNNKPYFEFIADFKFYEGDPLTFTVISDKVYIGAEPSFTDMPVIPEYVYDPNGLMRNFSVKQIAENGEQLKSDSKMKEFADDFNSEKRMRDKNFISGSGAYKLSDWKTNERVVITKKENWWGDALEKENCYFEAYPEKLIYQFISDETTALVALKAGNLDVMYTIKSKNFHELKQSEKFMKNFNAYTPPYFAYTYIGINVNSPLLSDKLTRKAIAHLVDTKTIIETIKYGQAQQIIGPVHPSKKKSYNTSIVPYAFNPETAKGLLTKAGWKNTNGDETLDKIINGTLTEFIIDFYVNAESDERKSMALMLQAEAKKVGIKINVLTPDFAVYQKKCKQHKFDLIIGSWIAGPSTDDYKQNFHSESTLNEGGNFSDFSNPEADAIIDSIRTELDEDKRSVYYKRLQVILHEELPMIFLFAPTERIAISKKFENAYPSSARPGFWEQGFKLKTDAD